VTENQIPTEPEHEDYDTDVPFGALLLPDYEAEQTDEVIEVFEDGESA
jgi:hypothetical protein